MLKLGRVSKVKVLFQVLVYVFNFDLFEFSTTIYEKGLLLVLLLSLECCKTKIKVITLANHK